MELKKGQREILAQHIDVTQEFTVLLMVKGQAEYNFTCIALDAENKLYTNDYLVSHQHGESPQREIRYAKIKNGGAFKIRLNDMPDAVNQLDFAVTIDGQGTMSEIESLIVRMGQDGKSVISLTFGGEDFHSEKSIIAFSVYRKPDWRFRAVISGFDKGLYSILRSYTNSDNKQVSTTIGDELDIEQYIQAIGRRTGEFFINDYMDFFEEKLSDIDADMKNIYIVNAGSMNHGKSSLFNSLLNSSTFAAQDIRTTMSAESALWRDNVYLIDTPGLSAEESDDAEAFNAYRRANIIVYVHTAKIGELHKGELEAINKIKSIFNNDKYFWSHFCLVFTFIDAESGDNLSVIKEKTLKDIKEYCGGDVLHTFNVSNSRYQKGINENKPALAEKSGIPEFRKYLQDNFDAWLKENDTVIRAARVDRERKDLIAHLNMKKQEVQSSIGKKLGEVRKKQTVFLQKVETVVAEYRSDEQELNAKEGLLVSMKRNLNDLRNRHSRERASY